MVINDDMSNYDEEGMILLSYEAVCIKSELCLVQIVLIFMA